MGSENMFFCFSIYVVLCFPWFEKFGNIVYKYLFDSIYSKFLAMSEAAGFSGGGHI